MRLFLWLFVFIPNMEQMSSGNSPDPTAYIEEGMKKL